MKKNYPTTFLFICIVIFASVYLTKKDVHAYYEQYAAYIDYSYNVIGNNNCEQGVLNSSLGIVIDHGEAVRLSTGKHWFNNRYYNACYYNTSGNDIFVPTRTRAEKDAFNAHLPSGVSRANGAW